MMVLNLSLIPWRWVVIYQRRKMLPSTVASQKGHLQVLSYFVAHQNLNLNYFKGNQYSI